MRSDLIDALVQFGTAVAFTLLFLYLNLKAGSGALKRVTFWLMWVGIVGVLVTTLALVGATS